MKMLVLRISTPRGSQTERPERFPYLIGADASCDLRLNDAGLAAQHCRIVTSGDRFLLEPLTGEGAGRALPLVHGESQRLGHLALEVRLLGDRRPEPRASAAPGPARAAGRLTGATSLAAGTGAALLGFLLLGPLRAQHGPAPSARPAVAEASPSRSQPTPADAVAEPAPAPPEPRAATPPAGAAGAEPGAAAPPQDAPQATPATRPARPDPVAVLEREVRSQLERAQRAANERQAVRAFDAAEQAAEALARYQGEPAAEARARSASAAAARAIAAAERPSLRPELDRTRELRREAVRRYRAGLVCEATQKLDCAQSLWREVLELLPEQDEEYHRKAAASLARLGREGV